MKESDSAIDYDVIVCGAGPTGVLAANLLGLRGVRTLVLDREASVVTTPRAVGICEEGSRILDDAGLLQGGAETYHPINAVRFVDGQLRERFHADVDWRRNGHRAIRMFFQPALEAHMRKKLERFEQVEFWTEATLESFDDQPDAVAVDIRRPDGPVRLRCRYLLGCDGAKSAVRKQLGIGFSGSTYPQDWVILDIRNNPILDHDVAFCIDPGRPSVTMPGPGGRRRWEFVVKKDDDVETIFEDRNLMRLIAPWGDMSDVEIVRKAVYTFHARTASHYQRGNVFLLGDSAHVTPPFAGQGMMAGLRDAYNLCWKLAAVLQDRAGPALLATYEKERIPQSKQIIRFAQMMGSIILPQQTLTAKLRDGVFGLLRVLRLHSKDRGLHVKKIPIHVNGSLLRHWYISRFRGTGTELPQFELVTPDGNAAPADGLIGNEFCVLGWNTDPAGSLAPDVLRRFHGIGGKIFTLTDREHFSADGPLLLDRNQHYRATFAGGARVLVMRPDRIVVVNCRPAQLSASLDAYLDSIGSPRIAETTAESSLTPVSACSTALGGAGSD